MNMTFKNVVIGSVLLAGLTGCSLFRPGSEPATSPDMQSDTLPPVLGVGTVEAEPGKRRLCNPQELERLFAGLDPAVKARLSQKVYYFATDASELAPVAADSLDAHVAVLLKGGKTIAQLTGHTDERGTHDYNLALGERRANAVARYLVSKGVSSDRIAVVSMGKEKPVADGHDEEAWKLNRRVELDYTECAVR